jgi:hypothetical protein
MCVLYGGFGSNGFMTGVQPFPMVGHYRMNFISGVGHPRSDLVVSLVLRTIAYNDWAPTLYYRSLRIGPTLLRKGNILSRPYIKVMTYKALAFLALK